MPTAKPRITITLSDEQHTTLQALAQVQGVSMSSIVVELLDTTIPVLQRLTEVLRNASEAPQAVLNSLKATLNDAESSMLGHGNAAMNQLELLVKASGGDVGVGAAPSDTAPASPTAKPPTSNRGVRIESKTSKNVPVSPMKNGEKNGRAKK